MSWVKIDDQFSEHPKVIQAGPLASWLYVRGLCYSAKYLTDGFIPQSAAEHLAMFAGSSPELLQKLVECSLWERTNGGYQIHDYLDYNPTGAQVKAEKAAAAERMRQKRDKKGVFAGSSPELRPNFAGSSASPSPSPSPIIEESSVVISEKAPLTAAAPPKSKPETAKTPKATKPPAEPPPAAIQALREIVGIYPPKATWDTLVAACKGKTKTELQSVYAEFLLRSPNKHNWTWVTDGVRSYSGKPNGKATTPNGLPSPETLWGTVQAEIDRVHYSGVPELPAQILSAIQAVGGWYNVCHADPDGPLPARLRDAYRSVIHA